MLGFGSKVQELSSRWDWKLANIKNFKSFIADLGQLLESCGERKFGLLFKTIFTK